MKLKMDINIKQNLFTLYKWWFIHFISFIFGFAMWLIQILLRSLGEMDDFGVFRPKNAISECDLATFGQ